MTYAALVLVVSLMLWLLLSWRFVSAWRQSKVTQGASLYAWGVFGLFYLVVTLDVPTVEQAINIHFAGLPVAAALRNLLILVTAQVFFLATRSIDVPSPHLKRLFVRVNPMLILIGIAGFGTLALSGTASHEVLTHFIKDLRSGAMLIWLLLIFIPAGRRMWQLEQVRPMKLHYAVSVLFYGAFALECISGLLWSFTLFAAPPWANQALKADQIASAACLLLIIVAILPFRWIMPLFYPGQLRLYLRLRRVEMQVRRWSALRPPAEPLRLNLTQPEEIDLAIYQTLIAVLDMYPAMRPEGKSLQEQIRSVVEEQPDFPELLRQLAAVRL